MTDTFICEVGDWLCYSAEYCEYYGIVIRFNSDKSEMTLQTTRGYPIKIQSSVDEKLFLRLNRQNLNDTEFKSLYDLEEKLIGKGILHIHRTKKMFDKHRDEFGKLFSLSRDFEKRTLVDLDMIFSTLIENYVIETKAYINKINELHSSLNSN